MGESMSKFGGGGAGDQGPTQAMLNGGGGVDLGTIASIASYGSAASSAFGQIQKGYGTKAADEFQASRAERSAEFGRLQADLTDTVMRERLNVTLSNIDTIRAAAHTDPTSPTGAAVDDYNRMIADRQRTASVLSIRSQTAEDEASAKYLRKAGDYAVTQGYIGAGISLAGAAAKAFTAPGAA